ncbi:MAG: hypothetical protein ABSE07_07755 [Methanoregula sp.]|jgi:hypothetical protein
MTKQYKNRRSIIKISSFWIILLAIVCSLLITIADGLGTISLDANYISHENPDEGKILLVYENFTENNQIPHNFFLGKSYSDSIFHKIYGLFFGEQKSKLMFDNENRLIYNTTMIYPFPNNEIIFHFIPFDLFKPIYKILFLRTNIPQTESLFIGGFVPMTKCEYHIELEKTGEKGFVIIKTPGAKIIIDRKNIGEYFVDSFFMNGSDNLEFKRMIVPTKNGKISLNILFDGIVKTNTISGDNQNPVVTPFYSEDGKQLDYTTFSQGYIKISNIVLPDQDTSTIRLYNLSQTAPRKLITPIGDKTVQPFGIDSPPSYTAITEGISYMKKFGDRGTIWYDISNIKDENYTRFLDSLFQNESWEVGIHYSKSLTELSSADGNELISYENNLVTSQFNTSPKTWCSLRNEDTTDHANYIFERYSMIWRNGEMGINSEPDYGNLEDATWNWWNLASKAGLIYPAFTHETDREPAIRYSISYSKFMSWVNNYQANSISIIPFHEWWSINANTNDTYITNISVQNHTLTFDVKTNGETALVNADVSEQKDLKIKDEITHDFINWTASLDNSITFYVESNHKYIIFTNETNSSL